MDSVRKEIQKRSGEAMKAKKADAEKIQARCAEIMGAMTSAGGENLNHKEITGVLLGDICEGLLRQECVQPHHDGRSQPALRPRGRREDPQ